MNNVDILMSRSLEHLKDRGFSPNFILDIGAFEGEWSLLATKVFPNVPILMLEGNPEKIEVLDYLTRDITRATIKEALLWKEDNVRVPFYIHIGGSSIYKELTTFEKKEIELETKTLDTILSNAKLFFPGLAKIDVQGAELDVLRGSTRILKFLDVIIMECTTIPYNEGAPIFAEVIKFMDDIGFVCYDLSGGWRRETDNAAFQIDIVFCRKDSFLREPKKFWESEP